jgi:molybdopterin/thiamine biosynthesis adenylyltransferase
MYECRFSVIPQTFIIVGCGGTGSRLIPLLAQFLKTCQWIVNPAIHLIDDDIVEEKNLSRQNFIYTDVGKPKAVVLAQRYSKAYNIPIVPIVEKVIGTGTFSVSSKIFNSGEALIQGNKLAAMVISCVDSMAARRAILEEFSHTVFNHGGIFLDGGNEDLFGQVMISNPRHIAHRRVSKTDIDTLASRYPKLATNLPVKHTVTEIPLDLKFYSLGGDGTSTRSCADLDQTMAINSLIAVTMFGMIQNILYSKVINTPRINVTLAGSFPEYYTPQFLWNISVNGSNELTTEQRKISLASLMGTSSANCKLPFLATRAKTYLVDEQFEFLAYELSRLEREKQEKELQAKREAERLAEIERKKAKAEEDRKAEEERLKQERLERARALKAERLAQEVQEGSEIGVMMVETSDAISANTFPTPVKRVKKSPDLIPKLTPIAPPPPPAPQHLEIPPEFRSQPTA